MRKSIAIVLVMASMTTANVANAEFVLGLQGGVSNSKGQVARDVIGTDNEVLGSRTTITHSNGNDTSLGIFGQYRHTLSNAWFLGAHLGYAKDSGEWGREYAGIGIMDNEEETGVRKYAADYTYDILAVVGYKGEKVNPFVMFGYSAMSVKGSASDRRVNTVNPDRDYDLSTKGSKTLNGWKLALGVEVPFSNALVGHALLHFAEYDGGDFFDGNDGNDVVYDTRHLDVSQQGIRFGIGYTF